MCQATVHCEYNDEKTVSKDRLPASRVYNLVGGGWVGRTHILIKETHKCKSTTTLSATMKMHMVL